MLTASTSYVYGGQLIAGRIRGVFVAFGVPWEPRKLREIRKKDKESDGKHGKPSLGRKYDANSAILYSAQASIALILLWFVNLKLDICPSSRNAGVGVGRED